MNSSPLNPDAPVFVPGSVAGSDVLLAESPRKPLPMDDIELPDVAQFETGAVVRPAELLDLDNCDHLNGHHNVSLEETKEQLNGNNKYNMDSLGFGFSVGTEPEKDTGLIQDFERIQKDTTDFCNIQVFQAHTETNPFATEDNDELLERLKNKERDPMSMSFYQEKDDDTCERLSNKEPHVDLNAVQPLPDSDDEDIQANGVCENLTENDKENISPQQHTDLLGMENDAPEPNNDIIRFDERKDILTSNAPLSFGQGDNFMDNNFSSSNMQGYSNIEFEPSNVPQDAVAHTDTPESHKLLFEQIPEIPDGKSSELGFTTEDLLDQTESEKDARILTPQEEISQDIDMENRNDDSPCIEEQSHFLSKAEEDQNSEILGDNKDDDIVPESELLEDNIRDSYSDRLPSSPLPVEDRLAEVISPEVTHNVENSVEVDVHQSSEQKPEVDDEVHIPQQDLIQDTPNIKIDSEDLVADAEIDKVCSLPSESPLPAESPLPSHSPLPSDTHLPPESPALIETVSAVESPIPSKSPLLSEVVANSPAPSPIPTQSPLPVESPAPAKSPLPVESPLPQESVTPQPVAATPEPVEVAPSPAPEQTLEPPSEVPEPAASPALSPSPPAVEEPRRSPSPSQPEQPSAVPADVPLPSESPLPSQSPLPAALSAPLECSLPVDSSIQREAASPNEEPVESVRPETASPLAAERVFSPAPVQQEDAPVPQERLSPELAREVFADEASAGPAPDIVPDVPRSDLVTDIDIGIPESRAQEICVPVTSEIRQEDGATPPPTPAAVAPSDIPPLSDTPIAADAAPVLAAAAAAATAVAAGAGAAAALKKPATKKSPTTPTAKPAPKTPARTSAAASPRTPASATKKPAPTTTTPRPTTAARTPVSATKPTAPKPPSATKTTSAKPAPITRPAPKPAPAKEPVATKAPAPRPATKAPVPKAPAARPATAAPKPAPKPPAPITRPPAARPATAPAARPATAPARPKPTDAKPKVAEKKPLANGDVKETKPAAARAAPAAARPAARPAPRPTPRAPATAPASATTKTAAPKPAPRAATATGAARPLDKQTKDLANKRITAKAAPPRTATTKTAPGTKSVPVKVPKKSESAPKPAVQNGLTNGADAELSKPPPSPPAADNALLPDVIA